MATGTGPGLTAPADKGSNELGEDDLKVVFKALHSVADKYVFLGMEMNVRMNEIEKIQRQCYNTDECLLKVLLVRLKQIPSLTWRDIDAALRSGPVGEPQLADRIRRQYGHLYSPDPSFEASLDQEQMSEMTKSKKKAKKEKYSKKYTQQDFNEEVSKSIRYRKPLEKVKIDVIEAVVKKTKQKAKKSPYMKNTSKPEKEYEKQAQPKGETQRKKKATEYEKESEVVCSSPERHIMKHSEQRAQKEVQIKFESESSASSSEQEKVQGNNFDSTEESYSSEQEEDSAEEVSETERYQKPSEQPRKSDSHREAPVTKKKGKISSAIKKSKYESQSKPGEKVKRKKKAIDQSIINEASQHEMADDFYGKCKRVARECEQKKSAKYSKKGVQKAPRKNESGSSAMRREDERVSSLYRRLKSRSPKSTKDTHLLKQTQRKKLEYQAKEMAPAKKEIEKKVKESVAVPGDKSSDEEVREKSAPKSLARNEVQTKLESENESSASTSDDQRELHLHKSTRMKEQHKMHRNTDGNENKKERTVRTKMKTKVMNQKGSHSSGTDVRQQCKEDKRSIKAVKVTKKANTEIYLKVNHTSPQKKRQEQTTMKVVELDTPFLDSTRKDSEDEESDSDDSSEDEEDRDSEQKASNEEEETEPDDESSPDTSEEEVKRKPAVSYMKERVKDARRRKGKKVKIAAGAQGLSGERNRSDPGDRDQEAHDIKPKKRSRRRHRESSMRPTTKGSSSPSTSQEENQRQPGSRWTSKLNGKGKTQRKKKESVKKNETTAGLSSLTETDNSSPECDILKNISETESKGLRKVFKRFFGRLCFTIKAPVELATRLQMKGLLTYSVMNELLLSPESEQAKSITLVKALQKQVKSCPDKMFNIIDIFLHNEVLQQTGREIWAETGKNNVLNRWIGTGAMKYHFMQEIFVLKDQPLCLAVNFLLLKARQ